jgi:heme/copper-type cytochrome/quinol oxidase subunit 3
MNKASLILPVGAVGERSLGWWGLSTLILTEAALFAYLLFSYFYLASQSSDPWPPEGLPKLGVGSLNTLILLGSSVMVWAAERALTKKRRSIALGLMLASIAMGSAFAMIQLHEWRSKSYGPTTNQYGSVYFTVTGFHLAHVFIGLLVLVSLTLWMARGLLDDRRHAALTIGSMYWHFVDAVWLFVFTTFYLTPYLLQR